MSKLRFGLSGAGVCLFSLSSAVATLFLAAGGTSPAAAEEFDLSHYGGDTLEAGAARRFCWQKEGLDFTSEPEDQAQSDRLATCIDKRLASKTSCLLKAVPSQTIPGCQAVVGYSGGVRVGEYHRDGKLVGLTDACLGDPRYLPEVGAITPPDRVTVKGVTMRLAPDCRDEEPVQ
jgi:hypothetical protein